MWGSVMCDVPVHQSISEPESQLLLSSISTHYLEMKVKDFANFYIVHWFTNSFFGHKNDVDHYRCANNIYASPGDPSWESCKLHFRNLHILSTLLLQLGSNFSTSFFFFLHVLILGSIFLLSCIFFVWSVLMSTAEEGVDLEDEIRYWIHLAVSLCLWANHTPVKLPTNQSEAAPERRCIRIKLKTQHPLLQEDRHPFGKPDYIQHYYTSAK